jgi:hypothetical protein
MTDDELTRATWAIETLKFVLLQTPDMLATTVDDLRDHLIAEWSARQQRSPGDGP